MKLRLCIILSFVAANANANVSDEIINSFPSIKEIQKVSDLHFYLGGRIMFNDYDVADKSVDNIGGGFSVGYQVNPYVAYDVFIDTFNGGNFKVEGVDYDFDQNTAFGLNLQLSTDTRKPFFGYTKVGYEFTNIEIGSNDENEQYLNVGAGLGYNITKSIFTSIEYRKGLSKEYDFDRDSLILNVGIRLN